MNKYGNRKITLDGITFDSVKEGERYKELKLMERCGKIVDLQIHPVFILQEGFERNGEQIKAIGYEADFIYDDITNLHTDIIQTIVEDVKSEGTITEAYRIKKKMFLNRYPQYMFREII